MHTVIIPPIEVFHQDSEEFEILPGGCMHLEHSLKSIAKWEAATERSFFTSDGLSGEDLMLYVRCMTINDVKDALYDRLTAKDLAEIMAYMARPMTARKFPKKQPQRGNPFYTPQQTVEDIYAAMVHFGLPIAICENWHFNRLVALIRTMESQGGGERMTPKEEAAFFENLNEARRKKYNTKG